MKNIYIRIIKKRLTQGEPLENILDDYGRLTEKEKIELTEAINM
jgi:uncharacterized protein (DUF433 family)